MSWKIAVLAAVFMLAVSPHVALKGPSAIDDGQILRVLEAIGRGEDNIAKIDKAIQQEFSRRNSDQRLYQDATMNKIISLRGSQCQLNRKACMEVPWAQWACRNQLFDSIVLVNQLWRSVTENALSEKEALAIWTQIKGCARPASVMQIRAAQILLKTSMQKGWSGIGRQVIPWLKGSMPEAPGNWGPAQGISAAEGVERSAGVYSEYLHEMEKLDPVPLFAIEALAGAQADWLLKLNIKNLNLERILPVVESSVNFYDLAGRRSKVADFLDKMAAQHGFGFLAARPEFAIYYCSARTDVGEAVKCEEFLTRMSKLKPSLLFDFQAALNLLYKGDGAGGVNKLNAILPTVKADMRSFSTVVYFYLAMANWSMANAGAAKTNLNLSLKDLAAAPNPLTPIYIRAFLGRIQAGTGAFAEAKAATEGMRATVKKKFTGKPWARIWIESNYLLAVLRAKSKADLSDAVKNLQESLIDDPSQEFYALMAEAAALKLAGKATAPTLARMSKQRGASYPDYKEFAALLEAF